MLFRCRRTFEFYLLALCLCFCTANSGSAQVPPLVPFVPAQMVPVQRDTPADITQETLPDAAPVQVQKAPLDPIVVFNPAGKRLIHLPYGWHLERFDEFYQFLSKRQQNAALNFVLQEVNAAGRITADRAEVRFRIAWTAVAEPTILIPLGLKEGIHPIRAAQEQDFNDVRYTGPGQFELTVDALTGQYVAVIKTKGNKSQGSEQKPPNGETVPVTDSTIGTANTTAVAPSENTAVNQPTSVAGSLEFVLWFPLTRTGSEENKLAISFPQAVRSQFLLDIPAKNITTTVSPGTLLESKESPEQNQTQLKIFGLKPDFELSWQRKKTETPDERPILFVEDSLIKVQLDVKSAVYDASLDIRSPSGEFDRFHIRLPQGTTLDRELLNRTAATDNFSWSEEQDTEFVRKPDSNPDSNPDSVPAVDTDTQPSAPASVIEIRLPRKVSSKLKLRLRVTRQYNQQDDLRDIEGFEVLEADRQTGYLSVTIPPDRRPNWEAVRWVRRTEIPDFSSTSASPEGGDTRFKFSSQPFLLRCRMITPETRINVKPEYQVLINKGSLALTARFAYVVLGSKTEQLTIDLPGWSWTGEIQPSSIVDTVRVRQDEEGRLTVPLRVPTDGNFEIELKAHCRIPAFDESSKYRLVLPLPRPAATWCESAPAVFVPGDNVEVIPAEEPMQEDAPPSGFTGLVRQHRRALPFRLEIPERQQEPLFYRTEPENSVFAADIQYHRQKTAAAVQTQVRLHQKDIQVEQLISYDVSYIPTDKLYFFVPKELEETGGIQVQQANRILDLRRGNPTRMVDAAPEDGNYYFVLLPDTQFKFQLVFRYSVPSVPVEKDLSVPFSLSFIRPFETQVTAHRVEMFVPNGYQVTLQDGNNVQDSTQWKTVDFQGTGESTVFTALPQALQQSADRISLLVHTANHDVQGTTLVDKAWLTTWLTETARIDYGTYHVHTGKEAVTLRLPQEAVKEKIFVYVDGQPARADVSSKGELTIPLTAPQQNVPLKISVFYRFPYDSSRSHQKLDLPHFDSADSETLMQREYWQLVLPQNKHVIDVPAGWAAEYRWTWNYLFFGRIPSLRRQDVGIEDGFSHLGTVSTESNQYLFSSMNPPNRSSFYTMNRSYIIFLSCALALSAGLLVIYLPKVRSTGSLLVLLTAFAAVLCYRPAPVLLMLQASSFGILLVLYAGYLYRIVHRNEKWVIPASKTGDASQPSEVYSVVMDDSSADEQPSVEMESKVSTGGNKAEENSHSGSNVR